MNFSQELTNLQSKISEITGQRKALRKQLKDTIENRKEEVLEAYDADIAVDILKRYLSIATEEVRGLFEKTVTSGLQEVFDETYEFTVQVVEQKNRNVCDFFVKTGEYIQPKNILMTQGTCLKELVSVMCRVIMICLDKDLAKVLFLDEPFSGAKAERQPRIAEFFQRIIRDFGIQVVMCTHSDIFAAYADKVVRI